MNLDGSGNMPLIIWGRLFGTQRGPPGAIMTCVGAQSPTQPLKARHGSLWVRYGGGRGEVPWWSATSPRPPSVGVSVVDPRGVLAITPTPLQAGRPLTAGHGDLRSQPACIVAKLGTPFIRVTNREVSRPVVVSDGAAVWGPSGLISGVISILLVRGRSFLGLQGFLGPCPQCMVPAGHCSIEARPAALRAGRECQRQNMSPGSRIARSRCTASMSTLLECCGRSIRPMPAPVAPSFR